MKSKFPAETQQPIQINSPALFHVAAFTLSAWKEASVMFKPMAIQSINVYIIILEISIQGETFKRKQNAQQVGTHFHPPSCFPHNSTVVASVHCFWAPPSPRLQTASHVPKTISRFLIAGEGGRLKEEAA